jgi:hypothetical protein
MSAAAVSKYGLAPRSWRVVLLARREPRALLLQ